MEYKTEQRENKGDTEGKFNMNHDNFMIFEVLDNGERQRLNITEEEFRKSKGLGIFHPKQVVIIVKEDVRRIYIWKGAEPHVRKKFIASRVAQELQGELIKRCKIVTVDQGDELSEFLNVFGFELKKLAEITGFNREISNQILPVITRQAPTSSPLTSKNKDKFRTFRSNTVSKETKKSEFKSSQRILEEVLSNTPPKNFKRKSIIIGENTLYSLTIKKVKVFGQNLEESEWEQVNNLPKGVFDLEGRKLRVHNDEIRGIKAIEILEPISEIENHEITQKEESNLKARIDYNKWTVKQLKAFCSKNDVKVPSAFRKAQIVKLVEDFINE
jgi:hypothetical protein